MLSRLVPFLWPRSVALMRDPHYPCHPSCSTHSWICLQYFSLVSALILLLLSCLSWRTTSSLDKYRLLHLGLMLMLLSLRCLLTFWISNNLLHSEQQAPGTPKILHFTVNIKLMLSWPSFDRSLYNPDTHGTKALILSPLGRANPLQKEDFWMYSKARLTWPWTDNTERLWTSLKSFWHPWALMVIKALAELEVLDMTTSVTAVTLLNSLFSGWTKDTKSVFVGHHL